MSIIADKSAKSRIIVGANWVMSKYFFLRTEHESKLRIYFLLHLTKPSQKLTFNGEKSFQFTLSMWMWQFATILKKQLCYGSFLGSVLDASNMFTYQFFYYNTYFDFNLPTSTVFVSLEAGNWKVSRVKELSESL